VIIQNTDTGQHFAVIGEFQLAERADSPTDVKTHAMIWAHLGEA
jgi:hypothetical protein